MKPLKWKFEKSNAEVQLSKIKMKQELNRGD